MSRILDWLNSIKDEKPEDGGPRLASENFSIYGKQSARLIAIASGKGGVGKTNFAVNLSIALSRYFEGRDTKTIIIDGDYGLPNVDIILGVNPEYNINHFLDKEKKDLDQIAAPTRFENLFFISGSTTGNLELANMQYQKKMKIINNLLKLKANYIIIDLGASSAFNVIDFFSVVNSGIIVINPEPTSVRDAYIFLKNVLTRKLRREFKNVSRIKELLDILENPNDKSVKNIEELLIKISEMPDAAEYLVRSRNIIGSFKPRLIVNRAENITEGMNTILTLNRIVKDFLGFHLVYLGPIFDDPLVVKAVKQFKPYYELYPQAPASICINSVMRRIIYNEEFKIEKNIFSYEEEIDSLIK